MTKEALRLALEALEGVLDDSSKVLDASISGGLYEVVQCRDAITAIKAALEAKDEPVAWAMLHDNGHFIDAIHPNEHARVEGEYITPLYTTPPQRTFVGLTDEEIEQGCKESWITEQAFQSAVWWAEAKLKEKNNA